MSATFCCDCKIFFSVITCCYRVVSVISFDVMLMSCFRSHIIIMFMPCSRYCYRVLFTCFIYYHVKFRVAEFGVWAHKLHEPDLWALTRLWTLTRLKSWNIRLKIKPSLKVYPASIASRTQNTRPTLGVRNTFKANCWSSTQVNSNVFPQFLRQLRYSKFTVTNVTM